MKKSNVKPPLNPQQADGSNPMNDTFVNSLQTLLHNPELMFQAFDLFPMPVEIFAPDGIMIFINRAFLVMNNIPDPNLVVGKYNLLSDPVCNDQLGMREGIQKAFHGEAVVCYDVDAPIQDVVNRCVIEEKPYEKSSMDFYLYPIMNGKELAFVVFFCNVKKLYYGRPDLVRAKEYLDTHWQDGYDAEAVAKSVNMSVKQLYNLFNKHTGITPGDYYRKCKVERIKEKLLDNNLSIKEAFATCGEDYRGAYAKAFKKITGVTPTEFRAKQSAGNN